MDMSLFDCLAAPAFVPSKKAKYAKMMKFQAWSEPRIKPEVTQLTPTS